MAALLTLDAAKLYLRVTVDDDDALIADQIEQASIYVVNHVGVDWGWTAVSVPAPVRAAVAIKLIHLYDSREAGSVAEGAGNFPPANIADLLRYYRTPVIA